MLFLPITNNLNNFRRFVSVMLIGFSSLLIAQTEMKTYQPFMFTVEADPASNTTPILNAEVEAIISAQKKAKDSTYDQMNYWNSAYPSYRWHQIMVEAGKRSKIRKNGGRMAILHLAIYDALSDVWNRKQETKQAAPFEDYSRVESLGHLPKYSTYICDYSATAAVAHSIISYYFPDQKPFLDQKLEEFKKARLVTGLQYPSDIELGLIIGENIAEKYIAYAKTDRTDKIWEGTLPKDTSLWRGKPNKYDPMRAQWKPFTLKSTDQFRPGPPPADWSADMKELQEFNKTNAYSEIAWKWRSQPIWDLLLERKLLEYGFDAFEAAYASALFHTTRFDATITAWDGKYHYWGIRPFQYDPSFKPILIDTPNFPGYPAGHTTVAGALAVALSNIFPLDADYFQELALECSESRFEGGVHFRTDNEVGLEIGEKVGKHVLENFPK
ncbi:PAP2 superfamily protein [Winogradskyella epiphytica]|uniref:PAP2 superfamily protein n=2 Tax=Winogradskyella epiphytica TaxID=262005 RepID=A0A2V4WZN9_9FLAO|nr:PAP2 superfamily protein [Winogradskyella epiphytica]